jgi:hypothetical protein
VTKLRPWLEGVGLTLLYLVPFAAVMLSPSRRSIYHQLLPATTLMRALLLDLVVLSAVCGAYFLLLNRRAGRTRDIMWLAVFSVTGWLIGRDIEFATREPRLKPIFAPVLPYLHYLPLVVLGAMLLVLVLAPRVYRRFSAGTGIILAAFGISAILVVLPRVTLGCFSKQPRESYQFTHDMNAAAAVTAPRVVWLLFDELSYDQVFDHRAPGLQLPVFDQFAKESVYFSKLTPVGLWTERVVPSLLLGQPIENIRVDALGGLHWRSSPSAPWQAYNAQQTIFGDARSLGWSTGVSGWFNPYCRLLAPVLNRCLWASSEGIVDGQFDHLLGRQSTLENALFALPLASAISQEFGIPNFAQMDREDYDQLLAGGESLIHDPKIRFAFIHLPIPHPPGIYQRPGVPAHHKPGYIDNLALCDQALGRVRAAIAATPDADHTVLIVSSDHSWRTQIWQFAPDWTKEDFEASKGGAFDDRAVLMVHYPGETQSDRIDAPASVMTVHSLLIDLLEGKINSEVDLDRDLHQDTTAAAIR